MLNLWRFLKDFPELWVHHCSGARLIEKRIEGVETELLKLRADLVSTFNDPATDKGYAAHKSISDQLNAKMQARLNAEDKARRHTTGDL